MSTAAEDALIEHATRIVDRLSKPTYVFRMARANPTSPSARKRLVNASREIVEATTGKRA